MGPLVTLLNAAALIVSTLLRILTSELISKPSLIQLAPCFLKRSQYINYQELVDVIFLNVRRSIASAFRQGVSAEVIANVKTVIMCCIKMNHLMMSISSSLKKRRTAP
jgi:hypothetical protein